jgi:hypothetical protein
VTLKHKAFKIAKGEFIDAKKRLREIQELSFEQWKAEQRQTVLVFPEQN